MRRGSGWEGKEEGRQSQRDGWAALTALTAALGLRGRLRVKQWLLRATGVQLGGLRQPHMRMQAAGLSWTGRSCHPGRL